MDTSNLQPQVLIIDDDQSYCALLKRAIESEFGVQADCYESLADLGNIGCLTRYQLVVLDYFLEKMTGVEIAEYLDALLPGKPSLIVSASHQINRMEAKLPRSVRAIIPKSAGVESITNAIRQLYTEQLATIENADVGTSRPDTAS